MLQVGELQCRCQCLTRDELENNLTQCFYANANQTILQRVTKQLWQRQYLHHDFQNEFLELMARQVLLKLMDDIKHSMFFGIMADEYTNISNKELLFVCFRTVNEKLEGSELFYWVL